MGAGGLVAVQQKGGALHLPPRHEGGLPHPRGGGGGAHHAVGLVGGFGKLVPCGRIKEFSKLLSN